MYSFYGGRPGNSFIIITSFKSVNDMKEAFSQGPNYTDVHFDEHVLINAQNKNDPDNGKIFRRGYNYQDSLGGAIQIGQIVGPAGPAPSLSLGDYDTVEAKKEETDQNPTVTSDEVKKDKGSYNINSSLVPGYDKEKDKYNDQILWTSCSIRTQDSGACEAYIGFKIPYLVMDWQAKSIGAYENPTIEEKKEQGQPEHPFYKKWELGIPKGYTGTSLSNLKVKKYNSTEDSDIKTVDGETYHGTDGKNIIIYNQTKYEDNQHQEGVTTRKYLGDYNIIQDIQHENGKLLIKCTNDNNEYREFNINEIEDISLDREKGQFTIKYFNNKTTAFSIDWLKRVRFDSNNGILTFQYTISEPENYAINWIKNAEIKTTQNGIQNLYFKWANPIDGSVDKQVSDFKWVRNLELTQDGILKAVFNDNSKQTLNENYPISWVTSIAVDENGGLKCITNNPSTTYKITTNDGFKWITSVSINENKQLVIHYSSGSEQVIEKPIKFIDNIELDTNGYLNVQYNTDTEATQVGQIRQIQDFSMDEDSGSVIVTYNTGNPETVGTIRYLKSVRINENNRLIATYSNNEEQDIGSVAANLAFAGDTAENLNWSGVGEIKVQTQENQGVSTTVKSLNFTTPTTSFIGDRDIFVSACKNLTATLKTSGQSIPFENPVDLISINKTLIGLNFSVLIPEDIEASIYNNLTDGTLIDVFISGVDLYFM